MPVGPLADRPSVEGRAEIGNYGRYEGEAVVSGPINDNLRFRLGGYYIDQSQGYFSNIGVPAYSSNTTPAPKPTCMLASGLATMGSSAASRAVSAATNAST